MAANDKVRNAVSWAPSVASLNHSQAIQERKAARKLYRICGQQMPLSWEMAIPPKGLKHCEKLGEGTSGEVYSANNFSLERVAIKVIPVEGSPWVTGKWQMTFRQVLRHITILKKMNSLRQPDNALNQTEGFIRLNNLHCVHGSYPMAMLNAWDRFNKERGSKNDRPDVYDQQQLFLILEFEFGGSDLENRVLSSMVVAKSILHQVTAALAVAENRLCFEHRNLHLGNVLVKTTLKKKLTFCHNGTKHSLDTKGVLVRIIDNNLARLNLGGVKVFRNIMLNEGMDQWERSDIFRCMLDANNNIWKNYQPESNILWIHYLSDKLRTMKYLGAGGPASKRVQEELASFHKEVLRYSSASDLLDYSPMFKVRV